MPRRGWVSQPTSPVRAAEPATRNATRAEVARRPDRGWGRHRARESRRAVHGDRRRKDEPWRKGDCIEIVGASLVGPLSDGAE